MGGGLGNRKMAVGLKSLVVLARDDFGSMMKWAMDHSPSTNEEHVIEKGKIRLERIQPAPRPNQNRHYFFFPIWPLQISSPPSTTIALSNALAAKD